MILKTKIPGRHDKELIPQNRVFLTESPIIRGDALVSYAPLQATSILAFPSPLWLERPPRLGFDSKLPRWRKFPSVLKKAESFCGLQTRHQVTHFVQKGINK